MGFPITVVVVGKPASHVADSVEHFCRLLRPHCDLQIRVVRSGARGGQESAAHVREREAEAVRAQCDPRRALIGLSAEGTQYDSEHFAGWVRRRHERAVPFCLIVGGAHGLAPSLKAQCSELISLSSLTLAHDVAIVVLLEQLFRAYSILRGHPYHK